MAKNITLMGADYPQVPAVQLPQTGGGTATYYDINVVDNLNSQSATDALSANQGRVLNEKVTAIGTMTSVSPSAVSVPTGTTTKVAELAVTAGKYIVIRSLNFAANANGVRILSAANTAAPGRDKGVTISATEVNDFYMQHVEFVDTSGETLNLYAYQNSGSTLQCWPKITAIKIA